MPKPPDHASPESDPPCEAKEASFRSLMDLSQEVYYRLNVRTNRFEYISATAEQIVGFTAAELMALDAASSQAMLHPEDLPAMREAMQRLENDGKTQVQYRQLAKDGGYRWLSNRMVLVRDAGGRPLYREGSIWDITHQRQAEEALKDSERNFRELVKYAPVGIYEIDFQTQRLVSVNDAMCILTGYTREELLVMNPFDLLDEKSRGEFKGRIDRWLKGEKPENQIEYRIRTKGGREIVAILNVTFTRDSQGRPKGATVIGQDITERKRAEESLRESEERFRLAIKATHAMVYDLELGTGRVRSMWGIDDLLGHSLAPSELTLAWWDRQVHPDDLPRLRTALQTMLETCRSHQNTYRIRHRDGRYLIVEDHAVPVCDAHGRVLRVVGIIVDITFRKQTEEALREGDSRKNHFLAVLSHELRNPLAPITNSLYILDRAVPGSEQARRAQDVIRRQIDQLAHLVDELLDITRISSGKIQLQRCRLELNRLIQRTLEDYHDLFQQSGVELRLEPAPGDIYIQGDQTRLAQVVGNLLQNAAKFTPRQGRVTVTVSSGTPAGMAEIRVTDTGIGIAPEVLSGIFQPFVQADRTLDRSKGGLGLGLALAKGLVEEHGGFIEARSEGLGQGAEFLVKLPLDPSPGPEAGSRRPATAHVRRRVLVVEDAPDAAESLREVLELEGHEVAVAYDGPGGLAQARMFHPDLVLCDLGLPGMDGYAVARAFRADPDLKTSRLVALSGYALPEDQRKSAQAGFDQHLAKPVSLETLQNLIAGSGDVGDS